MKWHHDEGGTASTFDLYSFTKISRGTFYAARKSNEMTQRTFRQLVANVGYDRSEDLLVALSPDPLATAGEAETAAHTISKRLAALGAHPDEGPIGALDVIDQLFKGSPFSGVAALACAPIVDALERLTGGEQSLASAVSGFPLIQGCLAKATASCTGCEPEKMAAIAHAELQRAFSASSTFRREVDEFVAARGVLRQALGPRASHPTTSLLRLLIQSDLRQFRSDLRLTAIDVKHTGTKREAIARGRRPLPSYGGDSYTLLDPSEFVGRRSELRLLEEWICDGGESVLCIHNHGGYGKSALAWTVFNRVVAASPVSLAGAFGWTFYRDDLLLDRFGIDRFVRAALHHLRHVSEDESDRPSSSSDSQESLLSLLKTHPHLLVLDGVERLLLAYATTEPALIDDAHPERQVRFRADAHLRSTIDREAGYFLQRLARLQGGRTIITSRLPPADLQTDLGASLAGVRFVELQELEVEDVLECWRRAGVRVAADQGTQFLNDIPRTPLLVRRLAAEVVLDRRARGQFATWRNNNPRFDLGTLPLRQMEQERQVLDRARHAMNPEAMAVLFAIRSFREATPYSRLVDILVGVDKMFAVEGDLNRVLTFVEAHQLAHWNATHSTYEMHPLVRAVVSAWFVESPDIGIQSALYDSLVSELTDANATGQPQKAMRVAMRLFCALLDANRFKDAADLYANQLFGPLHYDGLGVQNELVLLGSLFGDEVGGPVRMRREEHPYNLIRLAIANAIGGNPVRAAELVDQANVIFESHPEFSYQESGYSVNRAICEMKLGALSAARSHLVEGIELLIKAKDEFREGVARMHLGYVEALIGNSLEASDAAAAATELFASCGARGFEGRARLNEIWIGNLIGGGDVDVDALRVAEKLVDGHGMRRELVRSRWLRARASLIQGNSDRSNIQELQAAMIEARVMGWTEQELVVACDLVRAYTVAADTEAVTLGGNVVARASRASYRIIEADAANALAEYCELYGSTEDAKRWCVQALHAANDVDGRSIGYRRAAEDARRRLAVLH